MPPAAAELLLRAFQLARLEDGTSFGESGVRFRALFERLPRKARYDPLDRRQGTPLSQIGVWTITDAGPVRSAKMYISIEKDLEDWIERDPDLLKSGLTIVGRQVHLGNLRLDLLAITEEGQWVIIELKPGPLYRETLMQAIEYAAALGSFPADEVERTLNLLNETSRERVRAMLEQEEEDGRNIVVMIAGTAADPGLDRMVRFLADGYGVPLQVVTFDVFKTVDGAQLLIREITEPEKPRREVRTFSVDAVTQQAAAKGSAQVLDEFFEAGRALGLYVRPWATSVTLNPPHKHNITLVYARPEDQGRLHVGYSRQNLTDFYPLTDADVDETVGTFKNWSTMEPEQVRSFLDRLRELMQRASPVHDAE